MLLCKACKERQRKCTWQANNLQTCLFCSHSNRECVPFHEETQDLVKPIKSRSSALQYWYQEMVKVEKAMQLLDSEIQACQATKEHNHDDEFEWQLAVENGRLRLLSDIKSTHELLLYSQAYSQYLSPLRGLMFKQLSSIELDCEVPNFDVIINGFRFIYLAFSQNHPPQIHSLPPLHNSCDVNPIVHHLVDVYIKHQNPMQPILHTPTYLEHYRRLKDPLSCPITLAICTSTICSTRRVKGYTSIHRRQLSEFFFSKCKSILLDMFDDPNRQLDTVITISLLYHYIMIVLLDFTQARRLSTIAILLCNDMESTYRDGSNDKTISIVQKTTFQRAFIQTSGVALMMDYIYDCVRDKTTFYTDGLLKALPDEGPATHDYIELYSHVLHISFAPFVKIVLDEEERAKLGTETPHLVNIEHIFIFDEAIRKWWRNLPDNIRLCDDPFDDKALDRIDSPHKVLLYGYLHATTLLSYGIIIGPLYSEKMSNNQNAVLVNILYEHCVSVIIKSLEHMLSAVLRVLSIDVDVSILTFMYLIRSVHIFHNIFSYVPDVKIPPNVERLFMACMEEINMTVFPLDHRVPPHQSPLKSYMATGRTEDLIEFFKYPLPGYAFAADIFNTASIYLKSRFQGSSLPDPLSFVHFITQTPPTSVH